MHPTGGIKRTRAGADEVIFGEAKKTERGTARREVTTADGGVHLEIERICKLRNKGARISRTTH